MSRKKQHKPLLARLRDRLDRYEASFPQKETKILLKLFAFCFGQICRRIFLLKRSRPCRNGKTKVGIILYGGVGDHLVNIPFLVSFGKFFEKAADILLCSGELSAESFLGMFGSIEGGCPKNISLHAERTESLLGECDLILGLLRTPEIWFADKKAIRKTGGGYYSATFSN